MFELLLVVASAALVVAAVAGVVLASPLRLRRRVVVTLLDDSALIGVLWARRGRFLVLRGYQVVEVGREPVSADGEAVVHRDQIRYVQVIGQA